MTTTLLEDIQKDANRLQDMMAGLKEVLSSFDVRARLELPQQVVELSCKNGWIPVARLDFLRDGSVAIVELEEPGDYKYHTWEAFFTSNEIARAVLIGSVIK